jgi:hypothetical protein
MVDLLPQNIDSLLRLLPLNCHSLKKFLKLLLLNGHCLNEFLKHLDAVSLLDVTLLSCREAKLREICRLIEHGAAFSVFFILDVERFLPINISDTTFADLITGVLESLNFWILFLNEFREFSLELPLIDPTHHGH